MPSFVTLPFIQCHHVCGRAAAGGLLKSFSDSPTEDAGAAANTAKAATAAMRKAHSLSLLIQVNYTL